MKTSFVSLYCPFLFSFVLPSMINLFRKSIHSFSTNTDDEHEHHSIMGLGLGLATKDVHRPPNVLDWAMLRPNSNNATPKESTIESSSFMDDVGENITDGLTSCTESLGFESSNERRVVDRIDGVSNDGDEISRRRMMKAEGRGNWKTVRSFPPPLPSLNRNGKPNFFLRPVRKDGRLELTEVRIHRPEILHASRHDGRLTLHLIPDHSILEEEEYLEEEESVEEEEERVEVESEWRFNEGGLRRCHEMVNQHHHVHGNLRMCGISIV